jgi:hypothetical protein
VLVNTHITTPTIGEIIFKWDNAFNDFDEIFYSVFSNIASSSSSFFFFLYWAPVASALGSTAACRLIVRARLWNFSLIPPGASTPTTMQETSRRERGTMGEKCPVNFAVR